MATLRPPSSPSPSPLSTENGRSTATARASMGPRQTLSPRPPGGGSGARPTSELLGSATMFQTPESEAIDQWFENLQNYEETLEDMAAASLDVNFKEELSAIEQCSSHLRPTWLGRTHRCQGSRSSLRQSALLPCTVYSNSPLKCKSDFSSQFYNKWLVLIQ